MENCRNKNCFFNIDHFIYDPVSESIRLTLPDVLARMTAANKHWVLYQCIPHKDTSSTYSTLSPAGCASYHPAAAAISCSPSGRNLTRQLIRPCGRTHAPSFPQASKPILDCGVALQNVLPPRLDHATINPLHPILWHGD